ncbi:MAG: lysophospholipase [Elainella sp. Prado103]|jgi:pimeloyl-ACP methyl ester carboxylesterase|nr:lysophospholipase [Elainella sp. Prado103]
MTWSEVTCNLAPAYILFAQHGWADDNQAMTRLANELLTEDDRTQIVVPCLGYLQTWMRIEPLIQAVEAIATPYLQAYPTTPIKIIGHSMGGLIWLELLNRHPDWWQRIHSLVLVASPVGGADLGRLIDPFNLGIGIASDLGKNRRLIAERIATEIPTLVIAGDWDGGSDGTVTIECTKVAHTQFVCLPGLSHPVLRDHTHVIATIRQFWEDQKIGDRILADPVIQQIRSVPGMTDGHWRDFYRGRVLFELKTGETLRLWKSPFGIYHIFVASPSGDCLYAGFVGWFHTVELRQALKQIAAEHGASSLNP